MPLFSSKTSPFKVEKIELTTSLSLKQWTSENLKQWLLDAGYDRKTVVDVIYKQQFDGSAIIVIKPEDLLDIGVPRGATLSLLSKIKDLVEQQIQSGLIQDSNMTTGLSKSPRNTVVGLSPRTNASSSARRDSNSSSTSGLNESEAPLTTHTTSSAVPSSNHHHQQYSPPTTTIVPSQTLDGGVSNNNNQQKKPLLPRKSEATLKLQAIVVQKQHEEPENRMEIPPSHMDFPSTTTILSETVQNNEEETLEDELAFDIEHGLKISNTDRDVGCVSDTSSSLNIIDPIHIADIPMWNMDELGDQQREQFNYCYEKLKSMIAGRGEKATKTVCQNLSFSERFRYKYLNVASTPRYDHGSKKVEPFMKVKLIITEMDDGTLHRFIRRFGSALNNSSIQSMKFGMFHAALIIGPWYLEWGNSSIAVVRNRSSSKAVFAMDIGKIESDIDVSKSIDKLSAICTYYNTRKEYDNKKCNCQHFVEAVIDHLGLKNEFEEKLKGPIRKYVEMLKKDGICEMSYRIEPAIRDLIHQDPMVSEELKFLVNQKYIKFNNHRNLDEFVQAIKKKSKLYFEGSGGQYNYQLLKAFDRAFWLQSQSSKQSDPSISKPLLMQNNTICMCPFNKEHSEMDQVNNSIVGIDYEFGNLKAATPTLRKK